MRVLDSGDEVDEDAIYRQVGRLVVFFQMLETELVSLTSFAMDPEHGGSRARPELTKLWFKTLVDRTGNEVAAFIAKYRGEVPQFGERVAELLDRCRALARYRNSVVHSAFILMEGGGKLHGVLRSDVRPSRGAADHDPVVTDEFLTEDSFTNALTEIAEVAFGVAQCRVQLIHWSRRDPVSG